jgi:hypothetical protein
MGCVGNPPIETDFGPGTAGGHWDEECLLDELMTGFVCQGGDCPLSALTAATLQDLGYTVDVTEADVVDAVATYPCCQPARRLGGTRVLNNGNNGNKPELSPGQRAKAESYGQTKLAEAKANGPANRFQDGVAYVADLQTTIYIIEDGVIFGVDVARD